RHHRRWAWAFREGWTNPRRIRSKFVVGSKAISSPSVTKALRFIQRVKIGPLEGRFERIGRASLLASHRPRSPCPMRLGGSLALPISTAFEFFHTFRGVGVSCSRRKGPTPEG